MFIAYCRDNFDLSMVFLIGNTMLAEALVAESSFFLFGGILALVFYDPRI
jgi:hypothetical protein